MLRLRTFGGLALEGGGSSAAGATTQPKCLALLALLASAGERPTSRDKVLAYFWPETEPAKAAHRLAQVLYALRHDLKAESLFRGPNDLRLNPQVIGSDVQDVTEALERGELGKAVALYQGPFLDGFYLSGADEFERWVETERADYARKYCAALESLATRAYQRGDASGAAEWWRRLAEAEPLNSKVAVSYMQALSAAGDHAGALGFARDHERRLREEFDAAPDPAVAAAAERIRTVPPGATAAVPVARPAPAPAASVAVLPFVNLSPDQENEYFSDGMTEELTGALSRVPGLRVAARSSAFAFKGRQVDAREIGQRLGVGTLVEGSVRKVGDRIRLTAQLVNAADGYQLWSQSYERTLENVFALQEELARAIVNALPLQSAGALPSPTLPSPTGAVEAYTLYLRGRYFAAKGTVEGFRVAVEYFEQAIEREPGYAVAYAGLAQCHALLGFEEFGDVPARDAMPQAKAAALKALDLAPELADAHCSLAWIAMLFDWDWEAAEAGFRRAIELDPAYSLAHMWYAIFLSTMGRHDEAIGRILHAEAIDPVNLRIHVTVGRCYYWARRFPEALDRLRATLEMEPGHLLTHSWIVRTLNAMGSHVEALNVVEAAIARFGRDPRLLMSLGRTYAELGREAEARQVVAELRHRGGDRYAAYMVAVMKGLRDWDQVFELNNILHEERSGWLAFLEVDEALDGGRADPRFGQLLAKLGR